MQHSTLCPSPGVHLPLTARFRVGGSCPSLPALSAASTSVCVPMKAPFLQELLVLHKSILNEPVTGSSMKEVLI